MSKFLAVIGALVMSTFAHAQTATNTETAETPSNPTSTTEMNIPKIPETPNETPTWRFLVGRTTVDLDNASEALGVSVNSEYTLNKYLAVGASIGSLDYDITYRKSAATINEEKSVEFLSAYASITAFQTRTTNYGFLAAAQLGGFFPYTSFNGAASEFAYGASLEVDYKRNMGIRFEHKLTDASDTDINSISTLSLVGYLN